MAADQPNGLAEPETLDRSGSDEPPSRDAWPVVDSDSPAEARWRSRMEAEVDGHTEDLRDIKRDVRRVADHVTRGGAGLRLATSLGAGLSTVAVAAIGPAGANVKWLAMALVAVAALAWGGTIAWGELSIGTGASSAAAAGPAPAPTEPQE